MHGLKKGGVAVVFSLETATPQPENGQSQYTTKSTYEHALFWLLRGIPLVPLQPRSKSLVPGFGAYSKQITTEAEAWYWFGERTCNLAVVTGGGLVVLDFDQVDDYAAWCVSWPELADTYTERTARGMHVFIAGDSASGRLPGGIEIKGRGAVVMSAPSVHPSGFVYHPVDQHAQVKHAPQGFPLLSDPLETLSKGSTRAGGGKDTLTRIKAAYSVLDLAQSLTRLKSRDGRWWHGRCPFHEDSEPSFWVDAKRGLWGCYACNVRGDVVNLYAVEHGLSIQDAIRALAGGLQ